MEIDFYFNPIDLEGYEYSDKATRKRYGDIVQAHTQEQGFPDWADADIVILGVEDDRNAVGNNGCADGPDAIREYFYKLYEGGYKSKIVDLGNIRQGNSIQDTYFALKSSVEAILRAQVLPVILGGGQDLTFANYEAYVALGKIINIVSVDPLFDLGKQEEELDSNSYLSKIILHQPNFLFNYTNIGYQTYFVDQEAIQLMRNLFFDTYRLGQIRTKLEEAEPIIRNADMLTFDISAVRASDAPANGNCTPNGFYGEEACQLARYAGTSDKLTSVGFYEVNPRYDHNGQTAHLVAQMMWYFIDGFYQRKKEFPHKDKKHLIKYHVTLTELRDEIVFYKSKLTGRWWMEVPMKAGKGAEYERHHLIPCSYDDYQFALKDDIPDRWWQAYQKLM